MELKNETGQHCPTYHETGKECPGCENCEDFASLRAVIAAERTLRQDAEAQVRTLTAENEALAGRVSEAAAGRRELLFALQGVLRVADRATDEFDAARAAIAKNGGAG